MFKVTMYYIDVTVHCTRLGGVRLVDLSEHRTCKYMKLCPSGAATPTPRCYEQVDVVETAQDDRNSDPYPWLDADDPRRHSDG